MGEPRYDVAISFLHRDEPLALEIYKRLAETVSVFVYSKKQEDLAGSDGLESFREAFLNESRVVVVLFRSDWGTTPWTRVEQAAITDRFLQDGWEFLLFVMLDETDNPPKWLPRTEIRLAFQRYGLEQLLGAIKVRIEKLGGVPRKESAADRAKRFQAESRARVQREEALTKGGADAFRTGYGDVCRELEKVIHEANEHLSDFKIQFGCDGDVFTMRAKNVAVNTYSHATYPITEARMVIQEFDGPLALPNERGRVYFRQAQVTATEKLYFDYRTGYEWCWHLEKSSTYWGPDDVARRLLEKLLKLQERFDRREIRPDRLE